MPAGFTRSLLPLVVSLFIPLSVIHAALVFEPDNPADGKHIVLLAGDEEYRSEESMPMLGRLLARKHGFRCTVLFSRDPASGNIDPTATTNLPGLQALDSADLCIMALRFRELPDSQMRHIVRFLEAGKPLIALRTSTHAFAFPEGSQSAYTRFDWRSTEWPGGFGRQVLGETWVSHHGEHGKQSTRGVLAPAFTNHPILKGVTDIWGPTDVYTVAHLGNDARVLVRGQVLDGMEPSSPPDSAKNNPMMPLIWLRNYQLPGGSKGTALVSTIGAAVDFESEGLRRLIVNACYSLSGLEDKIPPKADVQVENYKPSPFGFGKFKRGLKPWERSEHQPSKPNGSYTGP